jgi:hypothetical protein
VVPDITNERPSSQIDYWLALDLALGCLFALIAQAFGESPAEQVKAARMVGISGTPLPGREMVQAMVDIIAPLTS